MMNAHIIQVTMPILLIAYFKGLITQLKVLPEPASSRQMYMVDTEYGGSGFGFSSVRELERSTSLEELKGLLRIPRVSSPKRSLGIEWRRNGMCNLS